MSTDLIAAARLAFLAIRSEDQESLGMAGKALSEALAEADQGMTAASIDDLAADFETAIIEGRAPDRLRELIDDAKRRNVVVTYLNPPTKKETAQPDSESLVRAGLRVFRELPP